MSIIHDAKMPSLKDKIREQAEQAKTEQVEVENDKVESVEKKVKGRRLNK